MGRKPYYQDSYGYVRRNRKAERASSGRSSSFPARVLMVLAFLTLVMVIAAAVH